MKKILLSGLLAGLVMFIASMLMGPITNVVFPTLNAEYQNSSLFRPWSDPLMSLYFVYPFVVGGILAWLWDKTKALTPKKIWWEKGATFGVGYWIITLPGMFISYSTFPISLGMVISWSLSSLVQLIAAGILLARIRK